MLVGEHLESCYTLESWLLPAPGSTSTTTTTTTSTSSTSSSSQITNFRAPRAAHSMGGSHHYCPLCHAIAWCRLQLNRSPTPTYVSTRGTREETLARDRKEILTSGMGGGVAVPGFSPTWLAAAANTILCQKAGSGQNLWLHMRIGSQNWRAGRASTLRTHR